MDLNEKAVFKTILYADIFDAPIDIYRLVRLLITKKQISQKKIDIALQSLIKKHLLTHHDSYYFLEKRKEIIEKRLQRFVDPDKKREIAKRAAVLLQKIPSVQFIGLSGALASGFVTKSDDIDLFIISQKGTIWPTRFFGVLLLELYGLRRRYKESYAKDSICLNMFISEDAMTFTKAYQDLYTAYEISQMIPLVSKNKMYERFLSGNFWTKEFLANTKKERPLIEKQTFPSSIFPTSFMVHCTKSVQMWYMSKHRTTETVTDDLFAFHPRDYRVFVLREYEKRLKEYRLV